MPSAVSLDWRTVVSNSARALFCSVDTGQQRWTGLLLTSSELTVVGVGLHELASERACLPASWGLCLRSPELEAVSYVSRCCWCRRRERTCVGGRLDRIASASEPGGRPVGRGPASWSVSWRCFAWSSCGLGSGPLCHPRFLWIDRLLFFNFAQIASFCEHWLHIGLDCS